MINHICMKELMKGIPGLLTLMVHPTKMITTYQLLSLENSFRMNQNYRRPVASLTLTNKVLSKISKILSKMISTVTTSENPIFKQTSKLSWESPEKCKWIKSTNLVPNKRKFLICFTKILSIEVLSTLKPLNMSLSP